MPLGSDSLLWKKRKLTLVKVCFTLLIQYISKVSETSGGGREVSSVIQYCLYEYLTKNQFQSEVTDSRLLVIFTMKLTAVANPALIKLLRTDLAGFFFFDRFISVLRG